MREILFRGKRVDNGEWVYGWFCRVGDKYANIVEKDTEVLCSVSTKTIGQYTGLTDKNGKKIFEGDIVDITQYDNIYHKVHRCCRSKVFFSNFAFRTNVAPDYEDEEPLSYWFWHDCDFEIIGNIHDNPELLEVTE